MSQQFLRPDADTGNSVERNTRTVYLRFSPIRSVSPWGAIGKSARKSSRTEGKIAAAGARGKGRTSMRPLCRCRSGAGRLRRPRTPSFCCTRLRARGNITAAKPSASVSSRTRGFCGLFAWPTAENDRQADRQDRLDSLFARQTKDTEKERIRWLDWNS